MLLSNKRDYNMRLQVADSERYREAVTRLKRILYETPSRYEQLRNKSPSVERKVFPDVFQNKLEYDTELPPSYAVDGDQKTLSSMSDLIRRQEDLIAQLEKENNFLKTEMISTAEASKEVTLQNEIFRKRLTETLIQMETSPDISSFSDGNEKMEEIINTLKEEREKLVDCIKLQEETIATLRERDIEAIEKVKQAVSIAEDSQKLSNKVRESDDQNKKQLQVQLEDALRRAQFLHAQLQKAHEREKEHEQLLRNQQTNLSKLEADKRDKDLSLRKRELDYQNEIEELKRNLKMTEEEKQRFEKLLKEKRNTSEATFKRLEGLLDRRNIEAETFATKRKFLEKQIWDLKHENEKLLQAINDLAKDRSSHTDDAKYAEQISSLSPGTTMEAKRDINEIKSAIQQHHHSILHLQEQVSEVRQDMTQGLEGLRINFEDLYSSVKKDDTSQITSAPAESTDKRNITLDTDTVPNSFASEGYDTMREIENMHSLKSMPAKGETCFLKEDEDTKILSIPFSDKVKSNEECKTKEPIEGELNNTTLSSNTKINPSIIEENINTDDADNVLQEDKSFDSENQLSSDLNPEVGSEERSDFDALRDEDNSTQDDENALIFSPKEIKTNEDDEKEKDECSTLDDEEDREDHEEGGREEEDREEESTDVELTEHLNIASSNYIADMNEENVIDEPPHPMSQLVKESVSSAEPSEHIEDEMKYPESSEITESSHMVERVELDDTAEHESKDDHVPEGGDPDDEKQPPLMNYAQVSDQTLDECDQVDEVVIQPEESAESDDTLPVMEAVVEVIGEEMAEIKDVMALQSKRIDNISEKVSLLPQNKDSSEDNNHSVTVEDQTQDKNKDSSEDNDSSVPVEDQTQDIKQDKIEDDTPGPE